jgi:polyhydroxyalkanoate synthesis regulator phasin
MAKQPDKKSKSASRAEAVRTAVDQAFSAGAAQAEQSRERAQDMVDQLAQAAGHVREVLDELRPPTAEDIKGLRSEIRSLERRVAALEAAQGSGSKPRKPAQKRSTTKKG